MSTAAVASSTSSTSSTPVQQIQSINGETSNKTTLTLLKDPPTTSNLTGPLLPDIRNVLQEVAQTGACATVSWNYCKNKESSSAVLRKQSAPTQLQYRRTASTFNPGPAVAAARKKQRNGLHLRSNPRKRPLSLIRTGSSASSLFSPGSVGSGRTSGSEQEDTTSQYECDSEGTTTTTNSEVSAERREHWLRQAVLNSFQQHTQQKETSQSYKTLQDIFRAALGAVLDYYYKHYGGYKVSTAERQKYAMLVQNNSSKLHAGATDNLPNEDTKAPEISAEVIFQQRKQRILNMLESRHDGEDATVDADSPPFTMQRMAEVLIAPERYYSQTHKLCNCLEKLLLVQSSTNAFGGKTGGDTSQARLEEREMAALADEKGRLQFEFRQRRLKRRHSSLSDDIADQPTSGNESKSGTSPEQKVEIRTESQLEAAARASLRSKFDHGSIDPHSPTGNLRNVHSIAELRGMTNSPPPPPYSMTTATSPPGLQGHSLLRGHHLDQDGTARTLSPILFNSENYAPTMSSSLHHSNPNIHLLQIHHAAALAGVSPFELVGLHNYSVHPEGSLSTMREVDVESRSSASSDVDSESDDVSFDDSASDRSDGSDSGPFEPFSAARAMALSRLQQQRLQVARDNSSSNSFPRTPPADTEYQSGDSIDSTRAEDSGGSDSSDLAD